MIEIERTTDTEPTIQDNESGELATALTTYDVDVCPPSSSRQTNLSGQAEPTNEECEREEDEPCKLAHLENVKGKRMTWEEYYTALDLVYRGQRPPLTDCEKLLMRPAEYQEVREHFASPDNQMAYARLILKYFHDEMNIYYDPRKNEFFAFPEGFDRVMPYPVLMVDQGPWDNLDNETARYREGVTVCTSEWMDDHNVAICLKEFGPSELEDCWPTQHL